MRSLFFLIWLTVNGWLLPIDSVAKAADLEVAPAMSSEGFLSVRWSSSDPTWRVQIAADTTFSNLLWDFTTGTQEQAHVSGFADGAYYVRLVDPSTSNVMASARFEVKHRSLTLAIVLFGIGAALFVPLIVLVVRGARSTAGEHPA